MNTRIALALIAIVSGGGLTALINALFTHTRKKQELRIKDVDERIRAWQQISKKNESRIDQLEQKHELCERNFKKLEHYLLMLEQIMIRADPPLTVPERPDLEEKNVV